MCGIELLVKYGRDWVSFWIGRPTRNAQFQIQMGRIGGLGLKSSIERVAETKVSPSFRVAIDTSRIREDDSSSLPMGRTEIPPGTLYLLVLRTLDQRGPMHGYGIAEHIQLMSADVLQVEEGSLYPALQRMLIKGWVKAEWGLSENNRRARYYRLTAAGKRQMTDEVKEFTRVMEAITRVIQPA